MEIGCTVTHVTIIHKRDGINVAGNVYVYGTNNGNVVGGDIYFGDIFEQKTFPKRNVTLTLPYALNTIKTKGGSFVYVSASFKELTLIASGQSDIRGTGQVDQLKVFCSGQSDIKAKHLIAKEITITASGQSDAKICATEVVNAIASGQADIRVYGDPQQVKKLVSGQATIKIKKKVK